MVFTVESIAQYLGAEVEGDGGAQIFRASKIEEAQSGSLAFLSNPKYEEYIYTTGATAVIVAKSFEAKQDIKASLIRVDDPYASFAKLLELYIANKPKRSGVSVRASVAEDVKVPEGCYIGDFAVVESGVQIGANVDIYPHCYIGQGVIIGDDSIIYAGAKIYEQCTLGCSVIVHSGAVIGADGFGFAPQEDGSYSKIPQIGSVAIADNVEIGANTCIDRATMGTTNIASGVKLDNLIQIAHNVSVGQNTVIAAQAGVAGSTRIGQSVMIGGQVGIVGHVEIADEVKLMSQSGASNSLTTKGEVYLGSPAIPGRQFHRAHAIFKNLPELRAEVLKLKNK